MGGCLVVLGVAVAAGCGDDETGDGGGGTTSAGSTATGSGGTATAGGGGSGATGTASGGGGEAGAGGAACVYCVGAGEAPLGNFQGEFCDTEAETLYEAVVVCACTECSSECADTWVCVVGGTEPDQTCEDCYTGTYQAACSSQASACQADTD